MTSPALADLLREAVPFALPLAVPFRNTTVREGVLIRGSAGWGEFAPFPEYGDEVAGRWLASAIESAYEDRPTAVRSSIPVNAIIPAVKADQAAVLARKAIDVDGCSTIKIKVAQTGQGLSDDEARVAAVRDVLRCKGFSGDLIRLDANGAWSVREAVTALRRLSAYGLQYVEQPCRTLGEIRELRSKADVRIALDEVVRLDGVRSGLADYADVVIVKVAPLGGIRAALDAIDELGLPAVVSGALDSAVGLSAGVALATAMPELPYACGLGTGSLLAADVVDPVLTPIKGVLTATRVAPDLESLVAARDRMTEERAAWWMARIAAAYPYSRRERVGL